MRTKNPSLGTRYFHAQYFSDEAGEKFIQHLSFEIRPSLESMQIAIQTVERSFTNLSRPLVERPDYVKWKLGHDYIVWVKRMAPSDLENDPFNGYSSADEGTVRVAVEFDVKPSDL